MVTTRSRVLPGFRVLVRVGPQTQKTPCAVFPDFPTGEPHAS
jgi:hypothetical protein